MFWFLSFVIVRAYGLASTQKWSDGVLKVLEGLRVLEGPPFNY